MTPAQIKDKIAELETWLKNNPDDPHHATIQKDKRAYEHKLLLLCPPPLEHKNPINDLEVNDPEILNNEL